MTNEIKNCSTKYTSITASYVHEIMNEIENVLIINRNRNFSDSTYRTFILNFL